MVLTPSRRALLAGTGAGLAGLLAGCTSPDSRSPEPEDGVLVTGYTVERTRSQSDRPPVVNPAADPDSAGSGDRTATSPDPLGLHTVGSQRAATELEIRSEATNAAGARRLLDETSYDSESVVVYQTPVAECYRLKLNYVSRDSDGSPDLDFCQVIRDAHTACRRDARDYVAALVRLPWPGEAYDGFSVGSGGDCDPIPPAYRTGSESE